MSQRQTVELDVAIDDELRAAIEAHLAKVFPEKSFALSGPMNAVFTLLASAALTWRHMESELHGAPLGEGFTRDSFLDLCRIAFDGQREPDASSDEP